MQAQLRLPLTLGNVSVSTLRVAKRQLTHNLSLFGPLGNTTTTTTTTGRQLLSAKLAHLKPSTLSQSSLTTFSVIELLSNNALLLYFFILCYFQPFELSP